MAQGAQPEGSQQRGFDRAAAGGSAHTFFEELWAESDPWRLDTSALDQRRYSRQLELLRDREYGRALEIGCAGGSFTRLLAPLCKELVAIDISERAIGLARAAGGLGPGTQLRAENVMEMDFEAEGSWDLVVLTETAYYLGWLYPMFDLGWLAHSLHAATRPGGRLLLANTISREDGIMSPWLIHTYHDLFRNAGYEPETETMLRGTKETVEFEVVISLFRVRPTG